MTESFSPERERRLNETFVMLADTLVSDFDVIELLDTLVQICVQVLHASEAGLMLADGRGQLAVLASSSGKSEALDVLQLRLGEGPCLDCFHSGESVIVAGLDEEGRQRWPRFAAAAMEAGFGAVHSVPMRLRGDIIGALNLFQYHAELMSAPDLRAARALADVATIGILQERLLHRAGLLTEQLQSALIRRTTIEQAKGILAERGHISVDAAFEVLRGYCRDHNLRVSELSRGLVAGYTQPEELLAAHATRGRRHPRLGG